MRSKILLILICIACLGISACLQFVNQNPAPNMPETNNEELQDGAWHLVDGKIDGKFFAGKDSVTLKLARGTASGFSGVNQYNTKASRFGSKITVNPQIFVTRKAGSIQEMRLESNFLSALRRVNTYKEDKNQLRLTGEGVELNFRK